MNVLFWEYFKSSLGTINALSTLVSSAYTSFNIKKTVQLANTHCIYKFSVLTHSTDSNSSTLQSLVVTIYITRFDVQNSAFCPQSAFYYFILFCFVLFYCFLFYLFRFVSFRFVSFRFISFHFISFHFISFQFISFYFILFYFILSYCGSQNKQRLFFYTSLNTCFYNSDCVFTTRYEPNTKILYKTV
jgi:hypothetical protein